MGAARRVPCQLLERFRRMCTDRRSTCRRSDACAPHLVGGEGRSPSAPPLWLPCPHLEGEEWRPQRSGAPAGDSVDHAAWGSLRHGAQWPRRRQFPCPFAGISEGSPTFMHAGFSCQRPAPV